MGKIHHGELFYRHYILATRRYWVFYRNKGDGFVQFLPVPVRCGGPSYG